MLDRHRFEISALMLGAMEYLAQRLTLQEPSKC